MTESQAGALLSALSTLLAAFGFVATATRDQFDLLLLLKSELLERTDKERNADARRLRKLRLTAYALALVPSVVVCLFGNVAWRLVEEIDLDAPYSALKAALAVVVAFWTALSAAMWVRVGKLEARIRVYGQSLKSPNLTPDPVPPATINPTTVASPGAQPPTERD